MKPLVVIGYHEFADINVEAGVLAAVDAEVVQVPSLAQAVSDGLLANAAALMVSVQPVDASLMDHMPQCQIISRVGTGLDAIDIPTATARGIWVTNVPDYAVDEVSTHAIALLLAWARRVPQLVSATRQGIWDAKAVQPYPRMRGQVLGVLGFGRIARATARKAQALGLEILVYDPYLTANQVAATGCRAVDWPTLLREADYISLHVPLTPETQHILNAEALAQIKPTTFVINTARGALIDEAALLAAIQAKRLAGAALDVLSQEPPPPDHPLLHEENIFVKPHIGWYSEGATVEVRVQGADNVVRVLRGQPPRTPVNQVTELARPANRAGGKRYSK